MLTDREIEELFCTKTIKLLGNSSKKWLFIKYIKKILLENKDISIIDSISYKDLRDEFIIENFDLLMQIDEKKSFQYILLCLDSISQLYLMGKYIEKFLIGNEKKAEELIESILDDELQNKIVKKLLKDLFKINKAKALFFIESISNNKLKDKIIIIFFNDFSRKIPKTRIIKLLNLMLDNNLKKEIIFKFFNKLFYENNSDSFELLFMIEDEKLRNELFTDSIQRLLRIDRNRTLNLYYSFIDNYEISLAFFKILLTIDSNKALDFLNSILDKKIKEKIIFNSFSTFLKKDKNKAFEYLAYSHISQELQYNIINTYLHEMIALDRFVAFEILKLLSVETVDKIIFNNISKIINSYVNNHKIKSNIFEIIHKVYNKKIKNQIIIDTFDKFFNINFHKAIKNLNYLDQESQEKIIIYYFSKLITTHGKVSITLLKRVKNRQKKENIIINYFEQILQIDPKLAIKLLKDISNRRLIDDTIKQLFLLFLNRYHKYLLVILSLINDNDLQEKLTIEACSILTKRKDIKVLIELLNYIKDSKLKKQIFRNTIEFLAQKKEIVAIRKIVNQTQISSEINKEIKEKYSHLIKEEMKRYVDSLNEIQASLDSKIKESVILDAYSVMQSQESSSEELDLKEITVERLSHLLISETDKKAHRELLSYLIERLKEDSSRDYSKLVYKSISESRVFEPYLFELEEFVVTVYFKQELKDFKELKETEHSVRKMLGKVLKNPKTKREAVFMKRFKRLRKIKDLHVVVPYVAKIDFDLAQALMAKRIDKGKAQEVQKVIFLNDYQDRWSRAVEVYNKIDNFYIKVELSKKVLDSFVPDFGSSFFIQAMMILDSQNIAETPNELSAIAPKEVLKYYGEMENEVENVLDEVIEKIIELQQRAKKAEEDNDKEWEYIEEEEKRLKRIIKSDEELYVLFVERYEIESFRRVSLLDLLT